MAPNKTVFLGIDGASYTLLNELMKKGAMPNLQRQVEQGLFTRMTTPLPDNSAVSWSSIMTGTNPGEHGIFGFTDLLPGTYTMNFPNFLSMKATSFWNKKPEERNIVINLPFTYPAQPLNGCLVSGFVAPKLERSVYPSELLKKVKEKQYRIDADVKRVYKSKEMFCDDVLRTLDIRSSFYREMFLEEQWDNFMIVFTGSDRLGHYILDGYERQEEPFYSKFISYYQAIDEEIGWVAKQIPSDAELIMVSDHGMDVIETDVNLNAVLQKNNMLFLEDKTRPKYTNILEGTKAFVLEPGRVYINEKGKYPRGSVDPEERETVIEEIKNLFMSLEYEGHPVVKEVVPREKAYQGEQASKAPDLVVKQNPGFSLRGTLGRKEYFTPPSYLTGVHNGEDAFMYYRGEDPSNKNKTNAEIPNAKDVLHFSKKFKGKI